MRTWRLRDVNEDAAANLARELGIRQATARSLVGRGFSDASRAEAFLRPRLSDLRPPVGLCGFDETVHRLIRALAAGQRIGIFGDYDVDGVTACALLATFLRSVGGEVVPRVARRDRGYGFGEEDALELAAQGCRLIVTVDCGTNDWDAILAARAVGIDVVVVDHHQVPSRPDHPAFALLNPHRSDSTYPFRGLASVGLAFFLAAATRTALRARGWFAARPEPDVRDLLDLVAVGTIADLAPLTDENRVLVAAGLERLSRRGRPGLAALFERAGIEPGRPLTETDVGWKIGPRLNAPGRLGDATPALALLLSETAADAAAHADRCEEANLRRRELQERIYEEALDLAAPYAEAPAITVGSDAWHPGVVGIVAAKLVERFRRPAIVVALDAAVGQGRGSVRTYGGVNVYEALASCREHLVGYGGHAQAAGLTVVGDRLPALREAFARAVAGGGPRVTEEVVVDAVVALEQVDTTLAEELARLAPFGPGNHQPIVVARGARVRESRRVGDGTHLKLTLACATCDRPHEAIAFRMADRDPGVGATVDLAFTPGISEFRGARRIELRVHDFRPA